MPQQQRFTPETVDALLEKLGSDDQFREHMLGDPVGALATLGMQVDPSSVPTVRKLPPKEAIRANREAMKGQMTGKLGMVFFFVE